MIFYRAEVPFHRLIFTIAKRYLRNFRSTRQSHVSYTVTFFFVLDHVLCALCFANSNSTACSILIFLPLLPRQL